MEGLLTATTFTDDLWPSVFNLQHRGKVSRAVHDSHTFRESDGCHKLELGRVTVGIHCKLFGVGFQLQFLILIMAVYPRYIFWAISSLLYSSSEVLLYSDLKISASTLKIKIQWLYYLHNVSLQGSLEKCECQIDHPVYTLPLVIIWALRQQQAQGEGECLLPANKYCKG